MGFRTKHFKFAIRENKKSLQDKAYESAKEFSEHRYISNIKRLKYIRFAVIYPIGVGDGDTT